tara:strand:- start:226 stop:573 length:348 start_codon:yes stop_codon:yes gene_type:complete
MAKDRFGYGTEIKPNWNDLGRDHKLDVQKQIGDLILQTLPSHISRKLDNTDEPYRMAEVVLNANNGNIDEAVKYAVSLNKDYMEKAYSEKHMVGDYYDFFINSVPKVANIKWENK